MRKNKQKYKNIYVIQFRNIVQRYVQGIIKAQSKYIQSKNICFSLGNQKKFLNIVLSRLHSS